MNYPSPQRVELVATLQSPGIVVLCDVYYPGWKLTVDERPAPIYRANWMMRGAAVGAGTHRLVFDYDPPSFRLGSPVRSPVSWACWPWADAPPRGRSRSRHLE